MASVACPTAKELRSLFNNSGTGGICGLRVMEAIASAAQTPIANEIKGIVIFFIAVI